MIINIMGHERRVSAEIEYGEPLDLMELKIDALCDEAKGILRGRR